MAMAEARRKMVIVKKVFAPAQFEPGLADQGRCLEGMVCPDAAALALGYRTQIIPEYRDKPICRRRYLARPFETKIQHISEPCS